MSILECPHNALYHRHFQIEHVWRPRRPSSSPPDYSHHALYHRHFGLDMCDVLTVLAFRNIYPVEHPSTHIKITLIICNSAWTRMGARIRNQTIKINNECTHNGQPYKTGVRHALFSNQLLDRRIVLDSWSSRTYSLKIIKKATSNTNHLQQCSCLTVYWHLSYTCKHGSISLYLFMYIRGRNNFQPTDA